MIYLNHFFCGEMINYSHSIKSLKLLIDGVIMIECWCKNYVFKVINWPIINASNTRVTFQNTKFTFWNTKLMVWNFKIIFWHMETIWNYPRVYRVFSQNLQSTSVWLTRYFLVIKSNFSSTIGFLKRVDYFLGSTWYYPRACFPRTYRVLLCN